ncbi:unnamed protein product [Prorocentrum cordatum]|uniref:Uncharacterized protein n=1 Tax=Prorocentrum cordatum TaxID=2364126 RepID=A0ABN9Q555_9DINO|nr:unnamed protein product [Polarella glacialis]
MSAASGLFRFVGFNPCAASRVARIADIVAEYPSHDAIVLGGTQLRSTGEHVEPERIVDSFRCYQFGYKRRPLVTPSCGITILLKKSRFQKHSVKIILPVPKQLWGRAECLLVRQQEQAFGIIGLYFPPRVSKTGQKQVYDKAVASLVAWLQSTLEFLDSKHALPLLYMDLNGGLRQSDDDYVAGEHGVGNPCPASAAIRLVLQAWDLSAANTFFPNQSRVAKFTLKAPGGSNYIRLYQPGTTGQLF